MSVIKKETIKFLRDVRKNNNRPWFQANKERYVVANDNMKAFVEAWETEMSKWDNIERRKLFRIYRDVRFSKDKTPYNSHWSMSLTRTKPYLRGGYFMKITQEGGYLASGFWNPNSGDMNLIRANIDRDAKSFRKAINNKKLVSVWGELEGAVVKTSPKGYHKDHPDIDLLRHKQFIFSKTYTAKEIMDPGFLKEAVKSYKALKPYLAHMSEILSYDLNGEPLY